jgi:hypothetical protein
MDNSILQHEPDARQPGGFVAIVRIFKSMLNWVARLVQLTEEEQEDAGIYLGDERND